MLLGRDLLRQPGMFLLRHPGMFLLRHPGNAFGPGSTTSPGYVSTTSSR